MKFIVLLAAVIPWLLSSCSSTAITARSETLVSFSPSQGGNRVALIFTGQSESYRSSDPVMAETREAIEEGLRRKGWMVVEFRRDSDYILAWDDEYAGSTGNGYNFSGSYDDNSFSGTARESRFHYNNAVLLLFRTAKDGRAIQPQVWTGQSTTGSLSLRRDHLLPKMARKMMDEFPKRE